MYQIDIENSKEFYEYCRLNGITDINKFIQNCFKQGYNIEKYGLLGKTGGEQEKWVEKKVIREKRVEIPVEVIKEIEIIKEIPVEVIKEIVIEKEIIKEVPVEKIVTIYDNSNEDERQKFSTIIKELEDENKKLSIIIQEKENIFQNDDKSQQLQQTIQTLMGKIREKDNEIKQLKEQIQNMTLINQQKNATYLRSSNLEDNLYK